MEHLVIGLYFLALISCCLCLWFWWELEDTKAQQRLLHERMTSVMNRLTNMEGRRR